MLMETVVAILIVAAIIFIVINLNESSKKEMEEAQRAIKQNQSPKDGVSKHDDHIIDAYVDTTLPLDVQKMLEKSRADLIEKMNAAADTPKPKKIKLTPIERKWLKEEEYAKSFFKDQYGNRKDYSHLEPWEAEEKLERLKERDGWVDDDVYYGLSQIARGDYPITELPSELIGCTDQELFDWFVSTFDETDGDLSLTLMKEIGKRLKPFHEPTLLEDLKNVKPIDVPTWVSFRKERGYFFSTKVYNACKRKYLSQFEKPKPKPEKKPKADIIDKAE